MPKGLVPLEGSGVGELILKGTSYKGSPTPLSPTGEPRILAVYSNKTIFLALTGISTVMGQLNLFRKAKGLVSLEAIHS